MSALNLTSMDGKQDENNVYGDNTDDIFTKDGITLTLTASDKGAGNSYDSFRQSSLSQSVLKFPLMVLLQVCLTV